MPSSVQELSLENTDDVVPQLDGVPNPDTPNRTTVTFTEDKGSVGANHSASGTYAPVGAEIDASTDARIQAWRDGTGVFFAGTSSSTATYSITRQR